MEQGAIWVRWRTYFQERFPLGSFGVYIACVVWGTYCTLCAPPNGEHALPLFSLLAMFLSGLGFFLLLRIADEFKDYEEDCRYRPYRPVPRGLVSLNELRVMGAVIILLLAMLSGAFGAQTLLRLGLLLSFFALMCVEFFVPAWLKRHHLVYTLSHMAAMPLLLQHFASFLPYEAQRADATDFAFLCALAFTGGLLLELSRKLRAPEDEEEGVETYSALWGVKRAALAFVVLTVIQSIFCNLLLPQWNSILWLRICLLPAVSLPLAWSYANNPTVTAAKRIRLWGNSLVLLSYLLLTWRL